MRCMTTGSCTDTSARVRQGHEGGWAQVGKQGKDRQVQPQVGKSCLLLAHDYLMSCSHESPAVQLSMALAI